MNVPARIAGPVRYKLTARDYWLLAESGSLARHERCELIEGELWVSPVHQWHARTAARMITLLLAALEKNGSSLDVFSPVSVDLTDDSVPEPDVSVGPYDASGKALAGPALRLAVEVADSTLDFDLERKTRLYGGAGVPEYWIVAREGARVIQQWSPTADGYAERREVPFGERLFSETISGLSIETAALLDA